ncbi:MAG: sulfatase, partial [Candidatus Bathyarchaeota archaeon]|nr:sulfatase [Candidatus Bathyarchaeota archaeon]
MNVILVMSDSLRADHLGCYGATDVRTPDLDRFAEESAVFDRAYIASYPTTPNRTDLWTGRYTFPFRGWQPLEPSDITIPLILRRYGITSHIVFDTPPVLEDGLYRGFSSWWQIRGHHADPYMTDPTIQIRLPAAPHKIKNVDRLKQYFRNRDSWRHEKDFLAPRTFMKASEWLERNRTLDRFFLMVDTWDPHEPFDPPPHYLELYTDLDEDVENILYPQYGRWNYMTNSELQRVRALYAGEVTMVDTWMGMLLDTV